MNLRFVTISVLTSRSNGLATFFGKQSNSMRYSVNILGSAHSMCLAKNEVEKGVLLSNSGAKVNHC